MPIDLAPDETAHQPVAHLLKRVVAEHIADLHNKWLREENSRQQNSSEDI